MIEISIVISELITIYLILRIWQFDDVLFFKISYSLIALIPFFGPFFVLWQTNIPTAQPRILQDQQHRQIDVYDRWRHVLEEKNPQEKFRKWKQMVNKKDRIE